MRNPASALLWELWACQRLWFLGLGIYFALVCLTAQVLPSDLLTPNTALTLALPLVGSVPVVLGMFGYGLHVRVEDSISTLPARLLRLPVSAATLAGVPFLTASLTFGLGWAVYCVLVCWPSGADLPLLWPALLAANAAGWLLVLVWMPYPLPHLRPVVIGLAALGMIFLVPWTAEHSGEVGALSAWLSPALAVTLALGYAAAVRAVVKARRGDGAGANWDFLLSRLWRRTVPRTPFPSSLAAQRWLEWRRSGWPLLWLGAFMTVMGMVLMHFLLMAFEKQALQAAFPTLGRVAEVLGPGWLALFLFIPFPFLVSLFAGIDLGRLNLDMTDYRRSEFLATRPVSAALLVEGKLWNVLRLQASLIALTVLLALAWAVAAGQIGDMAGRLTAFLGSPWAALLAVAGCCVAGLVLSVANLAAGLWVGLLGRNWVAIGCLVLGAAALVGAGCLATRYADWGEPVWHWLPVVLIVLVSLKALFTTCLSWEVRRRDLVSPRQLLGLLLLWVLVAGGLFALASWLTPAAISRWLLAGAVVLALPLGRIVFAPLAVEWNRHR